MILELHLPSSAWLVATFLQAGLQSLMFGMAVARGLDSEKNSISVLILALNSYLTERYAAH